jgi:hypothetical protein
MKTPAPCVVLRASVVCNCAHCGKRIDRDVHFIEPLLMCAGCCPCAAKKKEAAHA